MFKHWVLVFIILLLLGACQPDKESIPTIRVNPENTVTVSLEDITSSIQYVPIAIPDSIIFGQILHVKAYGDLLFLHDENQSRTITVIDKSGKFIAQLNKVGKGPGEYTDLSAFAYDLQKKELITYNRNSKDFYFYTFPTMEFKRVLDKDKYVMNIEVLKSGNWFVMCDDYVDPEDAHNHGAEIWVDGMPMHPDAPGLTRDVMSIEMSYPVTVSRPGPGQMYYLNPHERTTIFHVQDKGFLPIYNIDFGESAIPVKYWSEDVMEFEDLLMDGDPRPVMVQNLMVSWPHLAFWYYYPEYPDGTLAVYDVNSEVVSGYTNIRLENTDKELPMPLTVVGGEYVSVLYPGLMEGDEIKDNPALSEAYHVARENKTPILVIFKLKGF